jgi:hypothetical protein
MPRRNFPSSTAAGETNAALRTVYEHAARAPRGPDAAAAARPKVAAARRTIEAHLPEGPGDAARGARDVAPDDDGGHTALAPLVEIAGQSPEIIARLKGLLLATPHGPDAHPHVIPPDELVRHRALDSLLYHARRGDRGAKDAISRIRAKSGRADTVARDRALLQPHTEPAHGAAGHAATPSPRERYKLYAE